MRRSNIGKTLAANRSRKSKIMPGMMGMSAMKSSPATAIPGGTSAAMKKGGEIDLSQIIRNKKTGVLSVKKPGMKTTAPAKKPKVGIAIMIAVGKKKGKK
jgi:hypothetical protein